MRQNIVQPLRIRTVNARPEAHSRLERRSGLCRPIFADYSAHKLHVRCALHRGCMRAAGICWVAPGKPPLVARLCGYNRDRANPTTTAAPEWPPRAAVWHETRTRAAGMHAEYVWPCYAAQLRRCPRVSACVPDWVCLQASCSADSQKISLLGWLVGGSGARAVLLINARRSVRQACSHTHTGISFKSCRGVGCSMVGCISIILGRSSIIERRC